MSVEAIPAGPLPGEFRQGMKASVPVLVGAAPFGLLFGALAVENGLSVGEAVLMSALIYGGASQMVGIELFGQAVAPWLVVLSIVAVNFRHVLYSGALGRRIKSWPPARQALGFFFLVDPQYAESEARGERGDPVTFRWYMGMALPIYVLWLVETWAGAAFENWLTAETYPRIHWPMTNQPVSASRALVHSAQGLVPAPYTRRSS